MYVSSLKEQFYESEPTAWTLKGVNPQDELEKRLKMSKYATKLHTGSEGPETVWFQNLNECSCVGHVD